MGVRANEKSLDLNFFIDSSIPDHVVGDSFRLKQVILNLVGNAITFTERGEVSLIVREGADQEIVEPGQYDVEYVVEDTGVGIAKDKLDLIFNTFQQADGSITRKFGGTGLGLAILKRLVMLVGGDMYLAHMYAPDKPSLWQAFQPQIRPHIPKSDVFVVGRNTCTSYLRSNMRYSIPTTYTLNKSDRVHIENPPPFVVRVQFEFSC